MMLTVVSNRHGFYLIDGLPKVSEDSAGHDISHIISPVPEILALYQDNSRRDFVTQADNARRHWAKTVTLFSGSQFPTRSTSSSYSPDLTASGSWLFEYLKGVLQGSSLDQPDELVSAIQETVREIDRETLDAAF
jgi:hypothetical protein